MFASFPGRCLGNAHVRRMSSGGRAEGQAFAQLFNAVCEAIRTLQPPTPSNETDDPPFFLTERKETRRRRLAFLEQIEGRHASHHVGVVMTAKRPGSDGAHFVLSLSFATLTPFSHASHAAGNKVARLPSGCFFLLASAVPLPGMSTLRRGWLIIVSSDKAQPC